MVAEGNKNSSLFSNFFFLNKLEPPQTTHMVNSNFSQVLRILYIGFLCLANADIDDHCTNQLIEWHLKNLKEPPPRVTNEAGRPLPSLTASLTVGDTGPVLFKDTNLLDHLAHFTRERTPERMEHAKGVGAYGYFETTHNITKYTKNIVFESVGKKTPVAVRFSTTMGEVGSIDTSRDSRGLAIKFYTSDGNWDLLTNSFPIYWIRDPMLYPHFMHSQKRNPELQLKNLNSFWDFHTLRHETVHALTHLFSDRGIPDGYSHMNTYGVNTFKFVNAKNEPFYVKFHLKTDQCIQSMSAENASIISGYCPDWAVKTLYNEISNEKFPSWTLLIQVMTMEQSKYSKNNPFDPTKVWLKSEYPLIEVGKLVINKLPQNYYIEVEQAAFSPANFIPGIEASPDKILNGRLFAYKDSQRRRLGVNFQQLGINKPKLAEGKLKHYNRDGFANLDEGQDMSGPNYFPNSFGGPKVSADAKGSPWEACGYVKRTDHGDDDNYSQTRIFWCKVLQQDERARIAHNIAAHLRFATDRIRKKAIALFYKVYEGYGNMVSMELDKFLKTPFEY